MIGCNHWPTKPCMSKCIFVTIKGPRHLSRVIDFSSPVAAVNSMWIKASLCVKGIHAPHLPATKSWISGKFDPLGIWNLCMRPVRGCQGGNSAKPRRGRANNVACWLSSRMNTLVNVIKLMMIDCPWKPCWLKPDSARRKGIEELDWNLFNGMPLQILWVCSQETIIWCYY